MKTWTFSVRTAREILRDPLNLAFGLGFPLVLLLLMHVLQQNIPIPLFEIAHLTPGIVVFGLSFMTLFSATLLARDRESTLLQRLYTTPLTAADFVLGYALPVLPIAFLQTGICYAFAFCLGLPVTGRAFCALLLSLPVAWLFLAFGVLFGSILNVKQVGGICGALLTNLCAWLSGAWFDISLAGGVLETIANALPFVHAVEMGRAVLSGAYDRIWPHLLWVLGYAAVLSVLAVLLFLRQMKKQ